MHPYFTAVADFILAGRAYERRCRQLAEAKSELARYQREVKVAYPTQSADHLRQREAYCARPLERVREYIGHYDAAKGDEEAAYRAAEAAHAGEQVATLAFALAE